MKKKRSYPRNVKIRTSGAKVAFIIDATKDLGPSATGKTVLVATSAGSRFVGYDDLRFTLSVFKPRVRTKKRK